MSKLAVVAILAAFAVACQGFPVLENDIAAAAAAGNWDEVHRIISSMSNIRYGLPVPSALHGDVRSLKPVKGGTVYGESQYAFHSSSTDEKGKTNEQSGGHKIINDNGKVMEFDFKPTFKS